MRKWLRKALDRAGGDIAEAYLFGSVLDPTREPNDIDLVVVSADGADGPAWHRVRKWREDVGARFFACFGVPLSVLIATPSEWRELDGTVIRKRELLR